jgi:hypothetical protein
VIIGQLSIDSSHFSFGGAAEVLNFSGGSRLGEFWAFLNKK